jgi:hypothetical protein
MAKLPLIILGRLYSSDPMNGSVNGGYVPKAEVNTGILNGS